VQIKVLQAFNYIKPIDWEIESYFVKHPMIKELYEEKYGFLKDDIQ